MYSRLMISRKVATGVYRTQVIYFQLTKFSEQNGHLIGPFPRTFEPRRLDYGVVCEAHVPGIKEIGAATKTIGIRRYREFFTCF